MYVRYTESVRGADVFVLQSHYKPINKAIMEQLIMIDALKRASARSITAVCPLLGYSRQDKNCLLYTSNTGAAAFQMRCSTGI